MKILLIEDSFFWQKTIQNSLEEAHLPNAHLVSSIHEASDYLAFNTPDLIISDILVSKKIVYELFQLEKLKSIPTIFITSSDDEFLYEKKPKLDKSIYMIKPIHPLSLKSAIEHLLQKSQMELIEANRSIFVKGKYNEKIPLLISDIICVRAEKNYCVIKTQKVQFMVRNSLLKIQEELGADFIQVHRAYVVNKNKVEEINMRKLFLKTSVSEIPIGPGFKENILNLIKQRYDLQ